MPCAVSGRRYTVIAPSAVEHEVELTHFRPVLRARDGTHDFLVDDNLAQRVKVARVHRIRKTLMQRVALGLMLEHTGVGGAKLCLVEALAETLGGLSHLLGDFVVDFGYLVLDEHISAITLLRVLVVNQRVVERIHVARCLPDGRVHEDGRVDAHDVFVEQRHRVPPITFDIVFELNAVLTVVIHSR